MAIRSQQNSHPEPVPRASAKTFVELLDGATDRPGKACLLIGITCAPIFAIAICVSAVNAAHEMSSAEQFILWAGTVGGGSVLAFAASVGIRIIRKIRKTRAHDAALPTSKPPPHGRFKIVKAGWAASATRCAGVIRRGVLPWRWDEAPV